MSAYGLAYLCESRWFSWPMIYTLAQLMEWPASLACSDKADLRSQTCTEFRCSFSLGPTAESLLCHFFKTFSSCDIRYVPHTNVHQRKTRTLPAGKCCPNHTISQAYCRPRRLCTPSSKHHRKQNN